MVTETRLAQLKNSLSSMDSSSRGRLIWVSDGQVKNVLSPSDFIPGKKFIVLRWRHSWKTAVSIVSILPKKVSDLM